MNTHHFIKLMRMNFWLEFSLLIHCFFSSRYIYPHFADRGVPHIVQQIFQNLDLPSILTAQCVCVLWYNLVIFAPLWKELINKTVKSDKVWKELSTKRGW